MTTTRNNLNLVATAALFVTAGAIGMPLLTPGATSTAQAQDETGRSPLHFDTRAFARVPGGFEGESQDENHGKWIDVLNVDWGAHKPGGGATGQSRRRGSVVIEDLTLTMEYEKSSPKIQETCLKGEVIPKLEIDVTASFGEVRGGYLKYELENVLISSFQVGGGAAGEAPVMRVGLSFEEVKVTYTEYDRGGGALGTTGFDHSARTRK